jgi:type I restriction enzyme S subunit
MKDSGIERVGEIPQSWEVRPIKDVLLSMNRGTQPTYASDTDFFITNQACISTYQLRQEKKKECEPISGLRGRYKFGDVLVASTGEGVLGKCVLSEEAGYCDSHVSILRPKKLDTGKFIFYWLSTNYDTVNSLFAKGSTKQTEFQKEPFLAFKIGFPPLPEQRAVVDYLDRQTALIDQRLSTLEEKKAVLAELRKATIHEAVTKGINKSAPMKDSGVAWIGLVPSHWIAVRFKDVAKLNPLTALPRRDEIDFFPMEAIGVDGGLSFGQYKAVSQAGGYSQMKNGDVCFAKVTPCFENGKSAIVEGLEFGVALATTEITILRPNKKINRHFLHYRIKGLDFAAGGANEMKGAGGLKRVPERFAAEFVFQLPPLTEQLAIASHLDQQTQQIDAQLATLDEQAQVLKELRKAIIHEAVTGRIELPSPAGGRRAGDEGR